MIDVSAPARADRPRAIGVLGLWHLGSVTAACLADAGYEVIGVDPDTAVAEALAEVRPPVSEPGLPELLRRCASRLRFTAEPAALAGADAAWVAFDTPVDDEDRADVEWVLEHTVRLLAPLPRGALVIVSSQLPVGSIARLRALCAAERGQDDLRFACVPENLRLGQALDSFRRPERIVVGVSTEQDRRELAGLLEPFGAEIQWMRVESAEMTKHALNGFLATSVAFINEIATICEAVGADAAEVARGLKSERRIGPHAYLSPGAAFAGGTLARDVGFLRELADEHRLQARVFLGVLESNAAHRQWARRKLRELLGDGRPEGTGLAGRRVAVWGLTYKPGTDTLRRSGAIELCRWLYREGALVRAHDPALAALPAELAAEIELCTDPLQAAVDAEALVLCTAWPAYRKVPVHALAAALAGTLVVDPAGWLASEMAARTDIRHVRVGGPDDGVLADLAHAAAPSPSARRRPSEPVG